MSKALRQGLEKFKGRLIVHDDRISQSMVDCIEFLLIEDERNSKEAQRLGEGR